MNDFFENGKVLVQKYETLLYENKAIYFDIDEFKSIAYHYIVAREFDKAMDVAMHAELCFPESAGPGMIRARIMLDCQKASEALDLLDRLESKEPLSSTINVLKGRAYMEEGRVDEAILQFDLAMHKGDEDESFLSFNISDVLMEYGEFETALRFLSGILDNDVEPPFKAEIYFQAAVCYDNLNDATKAEKLYEKSLDEQPFNDYVWLSLGLLLEREERDEEAMRAFDFALTINDKMEPAVLSKANLLMTAERYDEAIELLDDHITNAAYSEYVLCYLGECYEHVGNFQKATECYCNALERDSDMPDAYWGIGKILKKQGDYENALRSLDYALDMEPENADYLFSKGEIFLEIGSKTAALEAFKSALRICPDDVEILTMISIIMEENDPGAALDEIKKAYASFPDDISAMFRLAVLYYRAGDIRNCRNLLWRMTELDPESRTKFFEILPEALENRELTAPSPPL